MRREVILSHLPATFKTASMVNLRQSSIHSSFLFEESKVKDVLELAVKSASLSFQQATARALVKPHPAPGTLLVERGSSLLVRFHTIPSHLRAAQFHLHGGG